MSKLRTVPDPMLQEQKTLDALVKQSINLDGGYCQSTHDSYRNDEHLYF